MNSSFDGRKSGKTTACLIKFQNTHYGDATLFRLYLVLRVKLATTAISEMAHIGLPITYTPGQLKTTFHFQIFDSYAKRTRLDSCDVNDAHRVHVIDWKTFPDLTRSPFDR